MKRLVLIACCFCFHAPSPAASHAEVTTITTLRGRSYHQCRISQVHPDGVSFFHANGAAKILFTELPESMRQKFGYSKQRAEEFQREQATRQFLERERQEKARLEAAERQRQDMDARLLMLERMALLQEQRLLLQQRQMAFSGFPAIAGPVPAVGWPANFYGPLNAIHGPAFGGRNWCRKQTRLASLGCGSGGIIGWGWPGIVRTGGYHGMIHTSPTLGSYIPGRFGFFGGPGFGGGCSIGFTGLNFLGTPPAPACAPVIMGSVAVPAP